jgi:glycosyltransferase involved in cell wall biosynthesis
MCAGPESALSVPSVAVVVPTHNRRDQVVGLARLVLADSATTELIVVADACTDGTAGALSEGCGHDDRLRVVEVDYASQFHTIHVGIALASADVVLVLDDDVRPDRGLVAGHARRHAGTTSLVVVGYIPTRLDSPRKPGQFARYLYAAEYERQCRIFETDPLRIFDNFWAGNFSLRRSDATQTRPGAPAGDHRALSRHADRDFGFRCRQAGLTAVFDRSLRAEHRYSRPLDAFLRDAWDSGKANKRLAVEYPAAMAQTTVNELSRRLPAPGRLAVRVGHWQWLRAAELIILRPTIVAAGRLHWWQAESLAANIAMVLIELDATLEP